MEWEGEHRGKSRFGGRPKLVHKQKNPPKVERQQVVVGAHKKQVLVQRVALHGAHRGRRWWGPLRRVARARAGVGAQQVLRPPSRPNWHGGGRQTAGIGPLPQVQVVQAAVGAQPEGSRMRTAGEARLMGIGPAGGAAAAAAVRAVATVAPAAAGERTHACWGAS